MQKRLYQLFNIRRGELRPLVWSFIYFFSLLCAYYILRPLRDEMGIVGGVENLHWVFTGTFFVMLLVIPIYGWMSSCFPRRQFLPWMYGLVIISLLLFYILFQSAIAIQKVAQAFFIWVSVFNLFIVSVFWSFMADLYSDAQSKRLFGLIATGGTAGALTGPLLAASLVKITGLPILLLISIGFLCVVIICIHQLILVPVTCEDDSRNKRIEEPPVLGGTWYAGILLILRSPYLLAIGGFILLYTMASTFLYFQQAILIRDNFPDSEQRTAIFAKIDLVVNTLTIFVQLFLTGRIVERLGLGWSLAIIPLCLMAGFMILGASPFLWILIVIQVLRRAGNYALMRPAREMLYVVLRREEKYKAKSVVDTIIYRGGDAVSAWIYAGLSGLGLSLGQIAWVAVPFTLVWAGFGLFLGKKHAILSTLHR